MQRIVIESDGTWEDQSFEDPALDTLVEVRSGTGTFRRCRFGPGGNRRITLKGGTLVLEDCIVQGGRIGVHASGASTARITRCAFENQESVGVLFTRGSGGTVDDCIIGRPGDAAVAIQAGGCPVMTRCTLFSATIGIYWLDGGRGEILDCDVSSPIGMFLGPGSAPRIVGGLVHDCQAVGIQTAGAGTITGTRITTTFTGMSYMLGADTVATGLEIDANVGLALVAGARGRIVDCTIAGSLMRQFLQDGHQTVIVPGP